MNYSEVNARVENELKNCFSEADVEKVGKFLSKEFSPNGKIVVVTVFIFGHKKKKTVDEILKVCEEQMEKIWKFQHPNVRGNPDAPGDYGQQNRRALDNIYRQLEIESPAAIKMEKMGKTKIPAGPFKVHTRNSVYIFGKPEKGDERSVVRKPDAINFSRCRIHYLVPGECMELTEIDAKTQGNGTVFRTSSVVSVDALE